MNKDEYLFLREEIMKDLVAVQDYRNVMYATVAAIYTFAFTQSEPLIFLVPLFMIIPIYKMCMDHISSTCKLGAYLFVFLEEEGFHWETRLHKYDEVYAIRVQNPTLSPYSVCVLASILLCIARLNYDHFLSIDNILRLCVCLGASIYCFIFIRSKKIDYIKEKNMYIERWKYIKETEKA